MADNGIFMNFVANFASLPANRYSELLRERAVTPETVTALLGNYLELVARERPSVGKSEIHNNGFLKLSLWRDPNTQAAIRIHFWPSSLGQPSSIHNHRWNFASAVLFGRLCFQNFEAADPEQAADVYELWHVGDADAGGIKQETYSRTCSLRQVCDYEVTRGAVHSLDASQLHRTMWPSAPAATLVLTGTPVADFSQVANTLGNSSSAAVAVPSKGRLERSEVLRTLEQIMRLVHVD